jgi:hypothetical protein
MAFEYGPGQLASIDFGATTVAANLLENLSTDTTPDTYSSAKGTDVERGSVIKTVSCNVLDYDSVAALNTLMTNRTESDIDLNYVDGDEQRVENCIVRVRPLVGTITDTCRVYAATAATTKNSLTTAYVDLGPTLGSPTFTFSFPFEGTDGCGRPYFSGVVRVEAEFMLPGDSTVTNPYTAITGGNLNGVLCDVAFQLPGGNFLVLDDVYLYPLFANEDASTPRAVRVKLDGTGTAWTTMVSYTDGAASSATDAWGTTTNSNDPGDYFAGAEVECVGHAYAETSLAWTT